MTEELEYADKTPDVQGGCPSSAERSCHSELGCLPSHSSRSPAGFQWISGLTALQSEHPDVQSQTRHVFTLLQKVRGALYSAAALFFTRSFGWASCQRLRPSRRRRRGPNDEDRRFKLKPENETATLAISIARRTFKEQRENGAPAPPFCAWRESRVSNGACLCRAFMPLQEKGLLMKHVLLVHLFVSDMGNFSLINSVYRTYFTHNPPARVCVQVSLPVTQQLRMDVLLHDGTAACEEDGFSQRDTLHVQSLSHWAPANIGPYSQAVRVP
ncbi:Diphthine--ammonia ligase [Labeo rohita]|uniref:Diphthine--ammonia ligase n=1 Tax=Labeo rohita TaxID=84645 RepID=A0ABQ8LVX5_LABRO|nr:Diphthine--ammonia ligase [Labeo rohita]